MLNTPAPFPYVGSFAFLRPEAEPVRILRRHRDNTCLIALTGHTYPSEIASGNRTVPFADLAETAAEAVGPTGLTRRRKRKADPFLRRTRPPATTGEAGGASCTPGGGGA